MTELDKKRLDDIISLLPIVTYDKTLILTEQDLKIYVSDLFRYLESNTYEKEIKETAFIFLEYLVIKKQQISNKQSESMNKLIDHLKNKLGDDFKE